MRDARLRGLACHSLIEVISAVLWRDRNWKRVLFLRRSTTMSLRILAFLFFAFAFEIAFFTAAPSAGFVVKDVSGLNPDNHVATSQGLSYPIQKASKAHAHDFDYLPCVFGVTAEKRDRKIS